MKRTGKSNINSAIKEYLDKTLSDTTYKYISSDSKIHRVLKVVNLICSDSLITRSTKREFTLDNFLLLCDVYECVDDMPENSIHIERYITIVELYTDKWEECSYEYFNDIRTKYYQNIKTLRQDGKKETDSSGN